MYSYTLTEARDNGRISTAPINDRSAELFSSMQDVKSLLQLDNFKNIEVCATETQYDHRRIKKGQLLYRQGQPFLSLYIVRFGFIKRVLRDTEGDERILSFSMKGNLLGFDGIYDQQHSTDAVALTDCEVVVIPFKNLLASNYSYECLEKLVYMAMSREINEDQSAVSLSKPLKCEARVARFLEELARRFATLGYSSKEFYLPMTRRDMGGYLGLSLETVSRCLTTLSSMQLIEVDRNNVKILEPELLHRFHTFRLPPMKRLELPSGNLASH
ncbi:cyclic nucleotide-binding domain-containing protein [Advenella sp. FME57]|uniref:cyclic nucleotide-binding domain-containing protein n=1 Tax=Advenella sp. FME57 TaxID=2742604 RepID=UPI0018685217|nr:cyclic nucleotide-binding domain-containing protein [Advenella sp. FME57]